MLGWSWLIPPYRWRFDARAVEMTLRGRKLLALHQANPALITSDEAGV